MEFLVSILLSILFTDDPCHVPHPRVECATYRIQELDNEIVDVCTSYNDSVRWEVVIDSEGDLIELWENDYPSFESGFAKLVWNNIYSGAITGYAKKPAYCSYKILNPNRHE